VLTGLTCLAAVGCRRRVEQENFPARIAILPAEVLIDDDSYRWAALASTFVLQQDLATSAALVPSFAQDQSGAYALGASAVVRSTVERRKGQVRIVVVVTDLSTQRARQAIESEGPESEGLIARLNAVSKRLDPKRASAFSTRSDKALQAFAAAAAAPAEDARSRLLQEAVAIDPAFGLAQSALLEAPPGGVPTVDPRVVARFVPLDRARYAALVARVHHAPIAAQAARQTAILNVAPNNVNALAELGWFSFLQGKPAEGKRLLGKAMELTSQPLQFQLQLAQGLVASHRFSEAAQLLQTVSAGNPTILPGLATAKLLSGDAGGANAVFARFTNLLPSGSPTRTFLEQQWKAMVAKQTAVAPMGATTPLAAGYRAFLEHRFPEAIGFWQNIVQRTSGTDLRARAMLAASLEGAGRPQQMEVLPYLPDFGDPYASVAFNEMRRLLKV
jgi:Tfp pilus assembly protein PilF